MDSTKVHLFSDYKELIKADIAKNENVRGYKSILAKAAGCQGSFLSHVLHSHVHITPEHAIRLTEFWNLEPVKTELFLTLVDFARAGDPKLQRFLEKRLTVLRQKCMNEKYGAVAIEDTEKTSRYYSKWYYLAIHVAVACGKTTVLSLVSQLNLPEGVISAALIELEQWGMVSHQGRKWRANVVRTHLPIESRWSAQNHLNWRLRGIQRLSEPSFPGDHYTAVITAEKTNIKKMKDVLRETISRFSEIDSQRAGGGDLVCFTFDFFKV